MINSVGVLMSPWLNNKVVPSFEMPDEVLHGKMTPDSAALKHPNMGSVSVNGTGGKGSVVMELDNWPLKVCCTLYLGIWKFFYLKKLSPKAAICFNFKAWKIDCDKCTQSTLGLCFL